MNLLYIVWDVSPYIHQFSATYAFRWYGVLFSLAFVCSYFVLLYNFQREDIQISILEKCTVATLLGGVLGARLGHCLFYEPSIYLSSPIRILYIWEGGMASHGGAIGVLLALLILSKWQKISLATLLSKVLFVTPLAGIFFRAGNLMNSEIYGIPTDLPWGFLFVNSPDVLAGREICVPRHPTQIYEMLCYLILFIVLFIYINKQRGKASDYLIMGVSLIGIFVSRFCIEFLKLPQVEFEQHFSLNMGQILSLPFILIGISFILIHYKKKNLKF